MEGDSILLQVGLVVLFCDGAPAGRGGEGSACWRWLVDGSGGSDPLLHPFSGRPRWRGEEVVVVGDWFLLQVVLVVLSCDGSPAGRGGEGSARWRWLGDGVGGPG